MYAQNLIDKDLMKTSIESLPLPGFVRDVEVETGIDASGEEAVWVWIVVDKGTMTSLENKRAMKALREKIYEIFSDKAAGVLPYIRLRNPAGTTGQTLVNTGLS
ncbi:hypothetical protein CR157_13170 [Halomonas sp. LBP4]|nr:hypothetical protein CR157_13170 [Halomonas sp. LBP4]